MKKDKYAFVFRGKKLKLEISKDDVQRLLRQRGNCDHMDWKVGYTHFSCLSHCPMYKIGYCDADYLYEIAKILDSQGPNPIFIQEELTI